MKYDEATLREVMNRLEYIEECYIGEDRKQVLKGVREVWTQLNEMMEESE